MTQTGGSDDPEIALQRQAGTLGRRFPDVDRAETEKHVTEDLRREGETVHVRSDDGVR